MSGTETRTLAGKTCLVTGATSGIGKVTAFELASRGANLVIVGRNAQKTEETARWITSGTRNETVDWLLADFSDLGQVRELADRFTQQYGHLHLLVNNAGGFFNRRQVVAPGVEMTLLVNHLSPFLLTTLLLDTIRSSAPARIVNLSSDAHLYGSLDMGDLTFARGYFGFKAYARSKLANVLFTRSLARHLAGSGVTVTAVHPGHVATDIWKTNFGLIGPVLKWVTGLFAMTPEEGADAVIHVATSNDLDGMSGVYFDRRKPAESSPLSRDDELARELWEVSERLTLPYR